LHSKAATPFNSSQKLLHNFLIWLIPFFWIIIVKGLIEPTPGSAKYKKSKPEGGFYESGIGIFGHAEDHHHHHNNDGHGSGGDGD
jgi:hypothetical protein